MQHTDTDTPTDRYDEIHLTTQQIQALWEQVPLPETVGQAGREKLEGIVILKQHPADRDMFTVHIDDPESEDIAAIDIVPPHVAQ